MHMQISRWHTLSGIPGPAPIGAFSGQLLAESMLIHGNRTQLRSEGFSGTRSEGVISTTYSNYLTLTYVYFSAIDVFR